MYCRAIYGVHARQYRELRLSVMTRSRMSSRRSAVPSVPRARREHRDLGIDILLADYGAGYPCRCARVALPPRPVPP